MTARKPIGNSDMQLLHEQVARVLAQEAVNTTAINALRSAIDALRDVISELGTNAAMQGQALLGIKEVFTKEVSQLREDQTDLRHAQQRLIDDTSHRDEQFLQKFENRFTKIEARMGVIEIAASRSGGYWDGSKYILGVVIVISGAAFGALCTFLVEHLHI